MYNTLPIELKRSIRLFVELQVHRQDNAIEKRNLFLKILIMKANVYQKSLADRLLNLSMVEQRQT